MTPFESPTQFRRNVRTCCSALLRAPAPATQLVALPASPPAIGPGLTAAFGCAGLLTPYSLQCALRSDSHFSIAAIVLCRKALAMATAHLAGGGATLRTTCAGGHLMFAETLLLKMMVNEGITHSVAPGAVVSPGNRSPFFDARASTT